MWSANNKDMFRSQLVFESRPFFLLSSMDTDWNPVLQLVADPADADYRQPLQVPTPPVSTTSILSHLHF